MFLRQKRNVCRNLKKRMLNSGLIVFIIFCLVIFMLIESFFFLERHLRPAILSIAEIQADILATDAVNKAIMDKITGNLMYHDLITIVQNEHGRIIMAQVNTMEVNRLIAETTIATQDALIDMVQEPIKIPVGEVFDNYLLAAYGPRIPVKLIPLGRVNTRVMDNLEDAGINQVRHKIYLDVTTEIRIVIPFIASELEVHTTVPLADAIYPGDVPETVINLNLGEFNPGIIPESRP